MQTPVRIVILGGGFGGVNTALELERRLGNSAEVSITLISRDNFFLFTPLLHEVAASDLDVTHIVSPLRSLLRRTSLFVGDVESIDLQTRGVTVRHGFDGHAHRLTFDHLVLVLGSVTNFYGLPGLEERALTMRTLEAVAHGVLAQSATPREEDSRRARLDLGSDLRERPRAVRLRAIAGGGGNQPGSVVTLKGTPGASSMELVR